MTPEAAKVKCQDFLDTLVKNAQKYQGDRAANNLRKVIQQGLLTGKIDPDLFVNVLQEVMGCPPLPYCLASFLKKVLTKSSTDDEVPEGKATAEHEQMDDIDVSSDQGIDATSSDTQPEEESEPDEEADDDEGYMDDDYGWI